MSSTSFIGPNPAIGFLKDNTRDLILWSDGKLGNWLMNIHTAAMGALCFLAAAIITPTIISVGLIVLGTLIIRDSLTRHPGGTIGKLSSFAQAWWNS